MIRDDPSIIAPALQTLRSTFAAGATRDLKWRKAQLKALAKGLKELRPQLEEALAKDLGRSPFVSYMSELFVTNNEVNVAISEVEKWSRPESVSTSVAVGPALSYIQYDPYGVALIIGTWNFPIYCSLVPLASAIAAGNAVLLKPSELSPHSSAVLAQLVNTYLDQSAVRVLEGAVEVAKSLLQQQFDYIFFTGSTEKGKLVARAAAEHLTPVTLELGGKSPTYVDKDCDLENAAMRVVFGRYMNAGQVCIAPDYVLVHEAVKDKFVARLLHYLEQMYSSNPQTAADFCRIVSEGHTLRLQGLLKNHGGRVLAGGQVDVSTKYVAPTIILEPSLDSPLMKEEIFGPILPIVPVASAQAAVDFINARPKPLALYIFTSSGATKKLLLNNTSSGGACVNETIFHIVNHELPFGGVGASGMSAYHGRHGFLTFSHKKAVLDKAPINMWPFSARYPPYTPVKQRLVSSLMTYLNFPQAHAVKFLLLSALGAAGAYYFSKL